MSLTAATRHLAERHPEVARLLERHGPVRLGRRPRVDERFKWLAESIAYQQVTGKAAATVWARVEGVLGGDVAPEAIMAAGEAKLRSAGLTGAKVAALLDLADRTAGGELDLAGTGRLDDEAVIGHLVTVRGIGRWTAEMFLIFALHRLDVWPVDDLGVRKGYAGVFGLADPPVSRDLDPLGDPFRPYRTVMTLYCWRDVTAKLPG
ncbi:MAG TPA: DNA-3-methyladenine glycosylase 2 family protein [Acidimicrobiia bacterium]|jgi:3-methyladenine DNA glycosylase/8-oxoguanine DNA glycosylase